MLSNMRPALHCIQQSCNEDDDEIRIKKMHANDRLRVLYGTRSFRSALEVCQLCSIIIISYVLIELPTLWIIVCKNGKATEQFVGTSYLPIQNVRRSWCLAANVHALTDTNHYVLVELFIYACSIPFFVTHGTKLFNTRIVTCHNVLHPSKPFTSRYH